MYMYLFASSSSSIFRAFTILDPLYVYMLPSLTLFLFLFSFILRFPPAAGKPSRTSAFYPSLPAPITRISTHSSSPSTHHTSHHHQSYYSRRRSLRQKGLEPEAKGFDYYAPARTPKKEREGGVEDEEEGVRGYEEKWLEEERERKEAVAEKGRGERGREDKVETKGKENLERDVILHLHCDDVSHAGNSSNTSNDSLKRIGKEFVDNAMPNGILKLKRKLIIPLESHSSSGSSYHKGKSIGSNDAKKYNSPKICSLSEWSLDTPESVKPTSNGRGRITRIEVGGERRGEEEGRRGDGKEKGAFEMDEEFLEELDFLNGQVRKEEAVPPVMKSINGQQHAHPPSEKVTTQTTVDEQQMDVTLSDVSIPANNDTNLKTTEACSNTINALAVDIDCGKLLSLFDRIVSKTKDCSLEQLEQLLSIFDHLVFRYRLRTDRRQLVNVRMAAYMYNISFSTYTVDDLIMRRPKNNYFRRVAHY